MRRKEQGLFSKGFLLTVTVLVIGGIAVISSMFSNRFTPPSSFSDITQAAISELTIFAEKGDKDSQVKLAQVLLIKRSPDSDKESFKWAKEASLDGRSYTSSELARYFQCGIGTKIDVDEAIRLYTPAAEAGDVMSQYSLSYLEKDKIKAKFWTDKVRKAMEKCKACDLPPMGCV